jgi:serine/threonine-protein kinase
VHPARPGLRSRAGRPRARQCRRALEEEPGPAAAVGLRYTAVVLGEQDPLAAVSSFDALLARQLNPRYASLICQLMTEQLCLVGCPEKALEYFLRAADMALLDREWIDRCPALAPLRDLPGFAEGRRKVRTRVEAIWNV